ncbi:probable polygalacturonase At3g15720 [Medicago truncatula]|uniref:probable polygalacturonase At3g15720 n=1 Tax=Medicago truncatula TaxID=3880 RepID=UPI0019670677|nr:probable polygalacturonase At3g15720 [Medicago truncatula]
MASQMILRSKLQDPNRPTPNEFQNFLLLYLCFYFLLLSYLIKFVGFLFSITKVFLKVWNDICKRDSDTPTLLVPSGKTFLLNPLKFRGPCSFSPVHFQLEGNIVAPSSSEAWKDEDYTKWIVFYYIHGIIIDGGGQIDGQGSTWWKTNCSVTNCPRPTALHIDNCSNLQLNGTHHLNSARNHISIDYSDHVNIFKINITAPQESPNTDGIDIGHSSYVLIQDSTIATGDDCIAMNNGTSNINITGVTCGPGHGISVGSLGENGAYEIVEQVYVKNCTFIRTENGMRIKTWPGGSGYARNISFEQIILTETKNPIIIDQNYRDLVIDKANNMQKSEVQISGVTYRDVIGTSNSKTSIKLNCNKNSGCTDIFMDVVNITSISGKTTKASCKNAHGEASSTSPYVPCLSQDSD